jgi:hypothetical protein
MTKEQLNVLRSYILAAVELKLAEKLTLDRAYIESKQLLEHSNWDALVDTLVPANEEPHKEFMIGDASRNLCKRCGINVADGGCKGVHADEGGCLARRKGLL